MSNSAAQARMHKGKLARFLATASLATIATAAMGGGANALVVRDDVGTAGAVDATNEFDGVGQMFNRRLNANGTVSTFLCTGTLINPRTVIFAQHCTADVLDEGYGPGLGNHMGFGFNPLNTLPAFEDWRRDANGVISNPFTGIWESLPDQLFYNVLQVETVFNNAEFFPGGDIAMASFDTPVADLTSYGILLSALSGPTHARLAAYGTKGTGSTGDVGGIDFARRTGENMIDGLFSLNDFLSGEFAVPVSFGDASGAQPVYHIDFDKPDRVADDCARVSLAPDFDPSIVCNTPPFGTVYTWDGTTIAAPSTEIDWYPGDALPNEAGTAGGDSGSSLFADDIYHRPLSTGVLSGGWVNGLASPFGGYGDVSYFNPLFLFRDWLVENNPYVYASKRTGSGNWSDPRHWVQDMDPNYFYIDKHGRVRNGLPDEEQPGYFADEPKWGTIFDTPVADTQGDTGPDAFLCQLDPSFACPPGVSASALLDSGMVELADPDGASYGGGGHHHNTGPTASNGAPTGPGSINFVPNNSYGAFGTWTGPQDGIARFFDVKLTGSGSTRIRKHEGFEIDHLTMWGDDTGLDLDYGGTLNVLMNVDLVVGRFDIDGTLNTRRLINTFGLIEGAGVINASHGVFNLGGIVSPGEDDVGTLTVNGDFTQAQYGWTIVDINKYGRNDMLVVNGHADIDGSLGVRSQRRLRFGDRFTIVDAESVTGNFDLVLGSGSLLYGSTVADADSIDLVIDAHSVGKLYHDSTEWGSLADAIDYARDYHYLALQGLFDVVDQVPISALNFAFTRITPINAFQQVTMAVDYAQGFQLGLSNRTAELRAGQRGISERSLLAGYRMAQAGASASEGGAGLSRSGGAPVEMGDRFGLFISGHGNLSNVGAEAYEGDRFDPASLSSMSSADLTFGADYRMSDHFAVGVATTISRYVAQMNETTPLDHSGYGAMLYASTWEGAWFLDSYVGVARQDYAMSRVAGLSAATVTDAAPGAVQTLAGARAGWTFEPVSGLSVGPTLSVNYSRLALDAYNENGAGDLALGVDARTLNSTTVETALEFTYQPAEGPRASRLGAYGRLGFAQEIGDGADIVSARFLAAPDVAFEVARQLDRYWVSAATGLSYRFDGATSAYLEANQDAGRGELSSESIMVGFNRRF